MEALQFASSLVVWGVFARTVLTWHITWSVNSVTHVWGGPAAHAPGNGRSQVVRA